MPGLVDHESAAPVARLNEIIIEAITHGEEINYLVAPLLGAAIETNPLEALTVGALLYGGVPSDLDGLVESVFAAMRTGGRSVMRDGAPVENEADSRRILGDVVTHLLENRIPLFRSVGILRG